MKLVLKETITYLEKLPVTGYEETNDPMKLQEPKIKDKIKIIHKATFGFKNNFQLSATHPVQSILG